MLSFLVDVNSKVTLILGGLLNVVLIALVYKKTPKVMRIYSKLVLQTCVVDLANLIVGEIVQPVSFVIR